MSRRLALFDHPETRLGQVYTYCTYLKINGQYDKQADWKCQAVLTWGLGPPRTPSRWRLLDIGEGSINDGQLEQANWNLSGYIYIVYVYVYIYIY